SARGAFCAGALTGSVAALPGANCDPSFSVMQIGLRTIWQPVRNLDLGVEVLYTKVDQNMSGEYRLSASNGRAAGLYTAADQDSWSGILRVQRNFWP
ncbi:MAG: porin, partial [Rhizobiales bacterium]|nr:porin [Hyphomicrobiales bacterium]